VQAAGLISGTGEGLFNPSGKFTRQSGIILMLNVWDYLQNLPEVAELPDLTPTEYTLDKTVLQNSLVSVGDASRFAKAFMKAAGGEAVTVAVIGGSITEGSNAADRAKQSYGPLVVEWMKEKFNNEDITLINAGESGTPSKLGVMRVQKQVLDAKPDIVFVEFAVNDGGDADSNIAYESLVRKILNSESEPAVALLFMMQETGTSNQANMQKTGTHYNLPMVSVKDSIYAEIKAGRMAWEDYSNDYVHPTGEGHAMVAELTEYCLEAVYGQARGLPPDAPYTVPEETVFGSKYEDIVFYTAGNFEPSQVGSFTGSVNDTKPLWNDGWKRLPNSGNSAFVCEVTGREVYLVYWATPGYGNPPGGKLDVSVNGGAAKTVNGGTSWGSPLHTNLWSGGTAETLTISMKMQEGSEANPFWILGIAVVP
jgi:lysophospholipase L1-like esterase